MQIFILLVLLLISGASIYLVNYVEFNTYNYHSDKKFYVNYNKVKKMIKEGMLIYSCSDSFPNNFIIRPGHLFTEINIQDKYGITKIHLDVNGIYMNRYQICLYPIGYLLFVLWLIEMNKYPKAKEKLNKKEIIENIWGECKNE